MHTNAKQRKQTQTQSKHKKQSKQTRSKAKQSIQTQSKREAKQTNAKTERPFSKQDASKTLCLCICERPSVFTKDPPSNSKRKLAFAKDPPSPRKTLRLRERPSKQTRTTRYIHPSKLVMKRLVWARVAVKNKSERGDAWTRFMLDPTLFVHDHDVCNFNPLSCMCRLSWYRN